MAQGIVPRASRQIFQHIQNDKRNVEYSIKASFVEIYKEKVRDLLRPSDECVAPLVAFRLSARQKNVLFC